MPKKQFATDVFRIVLFALALAFIVALKFAPPSAIREHSGLLVGIGRIVFVGMLFMVIPGFRKFFFPKMSNAQPITSDCSSSLVSRCRWYVQMLLVAAVCVVSFFF